MSARARTGAGALLAIACAGCAPRTVPGAAPRAAPAGPPAGVETDGPTGPVTLEETDAPPIADPVGASVVLAPGAGAAVYGGAPEAMSAEPLEEAVLSQARRYSSQVVLDPRLARACALLVAAVPDGAAGDGAVEYARQWSGIAEPDPALVVVRGDPGAPAAAAARLRARFADEMFHGPSVRIGVCTGAPGQGADRRSAPIGVLVVRSSAAVEPVPRMLAANASFTLRAVLHERAQEPELEIARGGRHALFQLPLARGPNGRVSAEIACGGQGRLDVELFARNPRGRLSLARFPVWCGMSPPRSYTIAPPGTDAGIADAAQAERRLIALVNRDRIAAGAPPLRVDAALVEAARRRAQVLRDSRGTAVLDEAAVGAGAAVSGAAGRGLSGAYEALASSPRDRERMLDPGWTHIGVGTAAAEDLYASVQYLAVPPPIDVEQGRRAVISHLVRVRHVVVDPELADVAQRFALGLVAGKSEAALYEELKQRIDEAGRRYSNISYAVSRSRELDAVRSEKLIGAEQVDDIGVGVAQGDHPELGRRTIWTVVFHGYQRISRTFTPYSNAL